MRNSAFNRDRRTVITKVSPTQFDHFPYLAPPKPTRAAGLTGAPHSLQNLEFSGSSVPHDPPDRPVAVSAPRPSSPWGPRQYRVTAGQRCLSYRRAISGAKFQDSRMSSVMRRRSARKHSHSSAQTECNPSPDPVEVHQRESHVGSTLTNALMAKFRTALINTSNGDTGVVGAGSAIAAAVPAFVGICTV